ncbi:putative indole-3-acetic acid-amido synthetase GH3.5 [Acorus calamus]|uniref:Indole-3-acetic acid-amido synthetase GH3.5 n=1 Tax=Acorus calamus TaxID=4465 RepID=A0AAV9FHX8_ACOCL|nr:putative indole-3-acetic acid-amido synthetase GH3.5 [Acorus calamus]
MTGYEEDIMEWFDGIAANAGQTQRETLRRILETNHGVEYLNRWIGDQGDELRNMDSEAIESLFTSLVPLSSHADVEPYIQRIADGDSSPILTQQPITMLSLRIYPIRAGGRILEFIYSSKQFKTKGGLSVGTATTHYFASEEFKSKQKSTKSFTCSPPEVISSGDYKQTTYCHLLLGFIHSDQVEFVTSTFAYSIVHALSALEDLWEELCEDMREGKLSPTRVTEASMRKAVLEDLKPNPSLASRMEERCEELKRSNWLATVPKLWPNAKYVYSILTGSMQAYLKKLRHYSGELPLVSADYGSTESWIGVNLDPTSPPEEVTFTIIPTFSYFEFIPLKKTSTTFTTVEQIVAHDLIEAEPLPISRVKVGEQYEVVLTTFTGQYRLGDVVEVAGFYKGTPQLNFICRRKLILAVNIDKSTEKDLQLVVEKGSQVLSRSKAEVVDFTSHANVVEHPGHYIIYWEIKGEVEESVLGECCREMDLSFLDHGYVLSRKCNSIGPLELRVVDRGTFKKILDYFIANGAAMSQYKMPRCTTNQVLLRILDACTVKRFLSTAY